MRSVPVGSLTGAGRGAAAALCPSWQPVLTHNTGRRVEDTAVTDRDQADEAMRARMVGYQAGEREAFEQLHADLAPILRRHLLRLARDASRVDDLLQETFLQIHRARHTYDPAFPVPPWACAIARHVFLMDCRDRQRRGDLARQEPLDDVTQPSAEPASHERVLIARFRVRHALSQLSGSTRQSVVMHHLHGLTFQEISRRLRIGGPALRARASRGMARLREALEDDQSHDQP